MNNKITVMLVDDSSVIRRALSRIIDTDSDIEIISSVSNGEMAVSMAKIKKPNIVLLDVEMPIMDGLTALPKILEASPETKVIMCSSLTAKGADITIKAMTLGAVESIVKPSSAQETGEGSDFQKNLIRLIKALGDKPNIAPKPQTSPNVSKAVKPASSAGSYTLKSDTTSFKTPPKILAIGSSTGGPNALFAVLKDVGKINVPIVITQHMPATFTAILAKHIEQNTGIKTFEAQDGMIVEAGNVYVAQGGKHMLFEMVGGQLKIKLDDGAQENFCKPAVDPMLRSLIEIYGDKILCVILTGMGSDGLKGASALSEKGGQIIAQDKETSVVWGMPGAVAMAGICSKVLPINDIASSIKMIIK